MSFSVEGRTAIITGAGNGVGLAVARRFVEGGAKVVFADLDVSGLKSEFRNSEESVRYYAGDLREKLTRANLLALTLSEFERVDILVNASREVQTADPITGGNDAVMNTMLAQNLVQHYNLTLLVADQFVKQKSESPEFSEAPTGAVVNISTIAARRANPRLVEYSVSCAALDQLTRSLAAALAPEGIRVNAVALGSVMTAKLQSELVVNNSSRKEIVRGTPLGRIGEASDVASAVQFMCSDAARFITGQVLAVDGGRSLVDVVEVPCH